MHFKTMFTLSVSFLCACAQVNITNLNKEDFTKVEKIGLAEVVAIGKLRCAGCHVGGQALGGLNFDPADTVAPEGDQVVLDKLVGDGLLDKTAPAASSFLTRPLDTKDTDTHQIIFKDTSDADYIKLLAWIKDGAPLVAVKDAGTTNLTAKFKTDVKPIFTASCATSGCHVAGAVAPNLAADSATLYADTKSRVTVNDGINSALVKKARGEAHGGGAKLTAESTELKKVIAWINAGALDD